MPKKTEKSLTTVQKKLIPLTPGCLLAIWSDTEPPYVASFLGYVPVFINDLSREVDTSQLVVFTPVGETLVVRATHARKIPPARVNLYLKRSGEIYSEVADDTADDTYENTDLLLTSVKLF